MSTGIRATQVACLFAVTLACGSNGVEARTLHSGESIRAGQVMYSDSGRHFAAMQHDGNFVVYRADGHPVWSTNTTGSGAVTADMQHDGNFVLYDSHRRPIWATGTWGGGRAFAIGYVGRAMVFTPGKAHGVVWEADKPRYRSGPRCHNPRTCMGEVPSYSRPFKF